MTENTAGQPQGVKGAIQMESYIGAKIIKAEPMSKADFVMKVKGEGNAEIDSQGKSAEGYLVEYEDGYQSWSPAEVFERCYRKITDSEKELCHA